MRHHSKHFIFTYMWWQIKRSRSIYICLTCTKNSRALLMVPRTTWVGHWGPPNSNNWLFKKGDIRTSCERVLSLFFKSVTHWYLYRMNQSFHCCLFQCKVSLEIFEITFFEGVVLNKARNQVNIVVGACRARCCSIFTFFGLGCCRYVLVSGDHHSFIFR